jgi:hypothetical protein
MIPLRWTFYDFVVCVADKPAILNANARFYNVVVGDV